MTWLTLFRLQDAILAAFDAGVEEDDLLPAFSRMEATFTPRKPILPHAHSLLDV